LSGIKRYRRRADEPFPVRGVPGGWRDPWDAPIDYVEVRAFAEAQEQRTLDRVNVLRVASDTDVRRETIQLLPAMARRMRRSLHAAW
jgi:hypothetical protein